MRKVLLILLLITFTLPACGGRTPSNAKTSKLTKGYFKKYGKKYKETVFHSTKVQEVKVEQTQELQKDVATSFVLVKLDNGTEVPVILTMIRKLPLGWRITGWEKVPR